MPAQRSPSLFYAVRHGLDGELDRIHIFQLIPSQGCGDGRTHEGPQRVDRSHVLAPDILVVVKEYLARCFSMDHYIVTSRGLRSILYVFMGQVLVSRNVLGLDGDMVAVVCSQ